MNEEKTIKKQNTQIKNLKESNTQMSNTLYIIKNERNRLRNEIETLHNILSNVNKLLEIKVEKTQ